MATSTGNHVMRLATTVLFIVAVSAPVAQAQVEARQWVISPRAGMTSFQRASSLKAAPLLGVDATYFIAPNLGIGTSVSVSRSKTRGEDFLAALNFGIPSDGDTTLYFGITQPVTTFDASLIGTVRIPFGRFTPFVLGGLGAYTLYLNPQVSGGQRRHSSMSGTIGGGLDVLVGRNSGVQIGLRDHILTNYKHSFLNPTDPRFSDRRFPEDFVIPPAPKNTIHNFQFTIGFSFKPGAGTAEGDDR